MAVDKGSTTTTGPTTNKTNVAVTTNVTGPPINIAVGSEFLQPVATAFAPVARGIEAGLQNVSEQTQSLANQAASIVDFTQRSSSALSTRQDDLEQMLKVLVIVLVGGFGFQFILRKA